MKRQSPCITKCSSAAAIFGPYPPRRLSMHGGPKTFRKMLVLGLPHTEKAVTMSFGTHHCHVLAGRSSLNPNFN